jgi:hypothetical protein
MKKIAVVEKYTGGVPPSPRTISDEMSDLHGTFVTRVTKVPCKSLISSEMVRGVRGGLGIFLLHLLTYNSRLSNCFPEHDQYIRCLIGKGRACASIARLLSFGGLNERT